MKSVAIIPIKSESERVNKKNFRLLNGVPLYEHFLNKMGDCSFNEVYVDTDSDEIKQFVENRGFIHIPRQPELATPESNGNDLLNYHASIIEADYYFQLFITAPLLKSETINKAVEILEGKDHQFDSIFTANKVYSWFWFNNKPINYDPRILPRSQDATPIIRETTGLYGIRRDALFKFQCRIGQNPYLLYTDDYEATDLDTEQDFNYIEFLLKNNSY